MTKRRHPMHAVLVTRKILSSAIVALAVLAVLLVAAPQASADRNQCSGNTVCVWSDSGYIGNFSWWGPGSGCQSHGGNPSLRSVWNRTSNTITIPGRGINIGPGGSISLGSGENSITGVICA
jgi:hypothetical protein